MFSEYSNIGILGNLERCIPGDHYETLMRLKLSVFQSYIVLTGSYAVKLYLSLTKKKPMQADHPIKDIDYIAPGSAIGSPTIIHKDGLALERVNLWIYRFRYYIADCGNVEVMVNFPHGDVLLTDSFLKGIQTREINAPTWWMSGQIQPREFISQTKNIPCLRAIQRLGSTNANPSEDLIPYIQECLDTFEDERLAWIMQVYFAMHREEPFKMGIAKLPGTLQASLHNTIQYSKDHFSEDKKEEYFHQSIYSTRY